MDIKSTKKLNNGVEIPYLGLGVFQSKNGEETENAVRIALEAGYRHIDTAAIYGNEESVGKAIRESGIPRSEIFLTTKLWNGEMRADNQRGALQASLKRLGVDYVDLYLIHWPVAGKYKQSWKLMEEFYAEGYCRAIGISNFHKHHIEDVLDGAKVVPAVNQIECHPDLSQEELASYCEGLGIAFQAWSPLGGGKSNLFEDATLVSIGKKYGKSAAQVMIRWELQRDIITIPKSVHRARIYENADVFDFELSGEDMAAVSAMNKNLRHGADPENFNF
ncbi:MAG: aldo/keto reductase [Eubacteriales bacterium]